MSVSKTKLAQEGTDGESLRASARSPTESGGGKHRLCDPPTMGVNVMPGRDGDTTTNAEPYSDSDNSRPAGSKMVKGRPQGQSIGLSKGHCEDNRFVALAVDDSDVDLGTGLRCSNSGHSAVGGRKQTPSPTFVAGLIGSDTDAEGLALAKVKTARKGKAKGTTAGPSRDRFLKPAPVRPGDTTTDNESDVGTPLDDLCALNAQELRAYAGVRLTNILEVARKSGDLKFIARIKRLTTSLSELVDALASRSVAEERRLLRAENRRLELEIEAFKSEAKALRRGIAEAKMEAAATASAAGPPATLSTIDDVEQLDAHPGRNDKRPARCHRGPPPARPFHASPTRGWRRKPAANDSVERGRRGVCRLSRHTDRRRSEGVVGDGSEKREEGERKGQARRRVGA